jgi:hypothetical protein
MATSIRSNDRSFQSEKESVSLIGLAGRPQNEISSKLSLPLSIAPVEADTPKEINSAPAAKTRDHLHEPKAVRVDIEGFVACQITSVPERFPEF